MNDYRCKSAAKHYLELSRHVYLQKNSSKTSTKTICHPQKTFFIFVRFYGYNQDNLDFMPG